MREKKRRHVPGDRGGGRKTPVTAALSARSLEGNSDDPWYKIKIQ